MTAPFGKQVTRGWSTSAKIGYYTGPREPNGCRLWTGAMNSRGYAQLRTGGEVMRVSRLLLGLATGDKSLALHSCDNPRCVEPTHVRRGTHDENMTDMKLRSRNVIPFGELHGNAKLTVPIVREVRLSKESQDAIGRRLGVSQQTIQRIRARKAWRHVD